MSLNFFCPIKNKKAKGPQPTLGLGLAVFFLIFTAAIFFQNKLSAAENGSNFRERKHLVFGAGTPTELEVYKIYGRYDGPTVMILGGIQGDEPGGFLSADLYADLTLKRGNLIVVPRANFKSITMFDRGPEGDMNRKFSGGDPTRDPELATVEIIKKLMAESDLFLNLHDGSGYYRPTWESEMANPNRYGQCIIADTGIYIHRKSGRTINLSQYANDVIDKVNADISNPLYKFHFFNTETTQNNSQHLEQRHSATYYALTKLGIPAFGIEASKQLPNLEMKIQHHNLAINAFLQTFGVEVESPGLNNDAPLMSYLLVSINNGQPLAVADGQTVWLTHGDTLKALHVGANYNRGLSADLRGLGNFNDLGEEFVITRGTQIDIQKDHIKIGSVKVGLLPSKQYGESPQVSGRGQIFSPKIGEPVYQAGANEPPNRRIWTAPSSLPEEPESSSYQASGSWNKSGQFYALSWFMLEVDGQPVKLKPGETLSVVSGALIKLVDMHGRGGPPEGLVMNLKGFVSPEIKGRNTGEDRSATVDTAKDMLAFFSAAQKGEIYPLNAETADNLVWGSSAIKLLKPNLETITIAFNEQTETVPKNGRIGIPAGTEITVTDMALNDDLTLGQPRLTLGGQSFPARLPQMVIMPDKTAHLTVWNGNQAVGKIILKPKK